MKKLIIGAAAAAAMLLFALPAMAVANYFNGFEVDTTGWEKDSVTINRVSSGTDGITSATGAYHAKVNAGSFTRWGGYESTFPTNGYVTKVDIYLDMSLADGSDKRFDFSSAINQPNGDHRRDYIFSVGTVPGGSATNEWAVSASNNSPGWPQDPGRSPVLLTQTGWYTFEHTFLNNAGVLEVIMKVKNHSGTVLGTWTLSNPTDLIGSTVGGNRYGWLVDSDFSFLAIDNSEKADIVPFIRSAEITSPTSGQTVSGIVSFDAVLNDEGHDDTVQWAVRKGTCAAGVENIIGNVDGSSYPSTWDGTNFHASANTSSWEDGQYCFVFNPSESLGDAPIRETSEFTVNNTPDNKEQCKSGGWDKFYTPQFKNQGDCVSYVQSHSTVNKAK